MPHIIGNYKRSIFTGSNGYLVGLLKVKEASKELATMIGQTVTFTGYVPDLNEIDTYRLEGQLLTHPKYGEQFSVQAIERLLPTESHSMIDILSSDMFKGIGKKTAEKIVSVFHEQSFEVILHRPNDLLLVPTITEKQARVLHEALVAYQGSYEIILALTTLGFPMRTSMKIYHHYKEQTNHILSENLYQIYLDIEEISFQQVDAIALQNTYPKEDPRRIAATIIYIMQELASSYGHTYFLQSEIIGYLPKIIKFSLPDMVISQAFTTLVEAEKIIIQEERIYLKEYYDAEVFIAKRLRMLAHERPKDYSNYQSVLAEIEQKNDLIYNEEQQIAMKEALGHQVAIITGGPGTGKTTLVKGMIDLYKALEPRKTIDDITLLAPTGRASKRLSETTQGKASTIHRFLKWNKETNRFQVNEYNKSEASFVIIDEASMIDTLLLANLLKGLTSHCKIIFVGDSDQLPSVGPGNILKDMIDSEEIKVFALKNLYRQGKNSPITLLAHQIRQGTVDFSLFNQTEELQFMDCTDQEVLSTLTMVCQTYPVDVSQVLAPMYKTQNGIDNINRTLQQLYNPKNGTKKDLLVGETLLREQDKVIQLSNMPDENVFNGDIGQIIKIKSTTKKEVVIDFEGNIVRYTPAMFHKFHHAYAISIHKSQGSEFTTVILPVVMAYHKMLYRKLIYTAVTRAKQKLILIGNKEAFALAVQSNNEQKRRTTLKKILKEGIL